MVLPAPIRYLFPVSKQIEYAKSWLDPAVAYAFDDAGFVSKYSKKVPGKSADIRAQARDDLAGYIKNVTSVLEDNGIPKKDIKRALGELPTADDLTNIVMSYNIYDTEDRKRVRVPAPNAVQNYNRNIM